MMAIVLQVNIFTFSIYFTNRCTDFHSIYCAPASPVRGLIGWFSYDDVIEWHHGFFLLTAEFPNGLRLWRKWQSSLRLVAGIRQELEKAWKYRLCELFDILLYSIVYNFSDLSNYLYL